MADLQTYLRLVDQAFAAGAPGSQATKYGCSRGKSENVPWEHELVGGLEHELYLFHIIIWNSHPNWLIHSFQRGRYTTNQCRFEICCAILSKTYLSWFKVVRMWNGEDGKKYLECHWHLNISEQGEACRSMPLTLSQPSAAEKHRVWRLLIYEKCGAPLAPDVLAAQLPAEQFMAVWQIDRADVGDPGILAYILTFHLAF